MKKIVRLSENDLKTLVSKVLKEQAEGERYMFFSNLQTIKRLVDEMLEMDETELDQMLTEHDWASDHVSVATENLEHVFNFVSSHDLPSSEDEDDEIPGGDWEESEVTETTTTQKKGK